MSSVGRRIVALGRELTPVYGARSMEQMSPLSRRRLLRAFAATGAAALFRPQLASSQQARVLSKPIPSTGEELPAVGLGSWITFNVGNDTIARDACAQVMRAFFDSGGRLIDSSPMYGSSQKVIGYGLTKLNRPPSLFSADKVWISSGVRGPDQIEASRRFWGVPRFDLLQVHNLLSWEEHTSELQSPYDLVCRLLLENKNSEARRPAAFTANTVRRCS